MTKRALLSHTIWAMTLLLVPTTSYSKPLHRWKQSTPQHKRSSLQKRFRPPRGFVRTKASKRSFLWWMRRLPIQPRGSAVYYFDGRKKPSQSHHVGVIDLDIGRRDLQQCADAVMRVWSEYLWYRGLQRYTSFNFLDGSPNPWKHWQRGLRPTFRRRRPPRWSKRRRSDKTYKNYRRYMRFVMAYSNTTSLEHQLKKIKCRSARAGDILLVGWRQGQPGHAILLLDEATNKRGKKAFLLAQSYMPAQSFHVLKAPVQSTSPWYAFPKRGKIKTPEWTFNTKQCYRFPLTRYHR